MGKESKVSRITKLVDHAVAMQNIIKDAQAKLDEAKADLRALAVDEFTAEQTKIIYAGSTGIAEVVYVADRAKLAKGANPKSVDIIREEWEHLFIEEVKLAPDFMARLALMKKDTQKLVNKVIVVEPCEPRVTIR